MIEIGPRMAEPPSEVVYPPWDGQPMESGLHVVLMMCLISTLREYFRLRDDYYVIGNIFLFYEEGNPAARRSPDLMLVKGVDATFERVSFFTWKEKAVPSVIVELTSKSTKDEDLGPKKELYERLGVREYFLFDPQNEYLERQLMGYLLIQGKYEEIQNAADGGVHSLEMGLRLVPSGQDLALVDFRTGERLLTPPETARQWKEAQRKLTDSQRRLSDTTQKVADLEGGLTEAQKRIAELEAELARLRKAPPADPPPEA